MGFTFGERTHVWNTFDAHRLLYWAGRAAAGQQRELKHALLKAYHGEGRNPGAHDVLLELAARGRPGRANAARAVLASDALRRRGARGRAVSGSEAGIHSVPSVIVNHRHLIQGGQPPEVFEQALRQIAAQMTPATAPPASG